MSTIELETSIVDHRIDVHSLLLPASASKARVIVMVDEEAEATTHDVIALARAARQSFTRRPDDAALHADLEQQREEWDRPL
jgi:hypothetical protein